MQKGLDSLEDWDYANLMKFNKTKYAVLHKDMGNLLLLLHFCETSAIPFHSALESLQQKKDMGLSKRVQRWVMKIIRGLEKLSYKERLSWGCLEKRRHQGDLTMAF
ncbi:hypothetical protein WISP_106084 [Willisornis vidua]|uniref:Uncharacterized protein n=1 Tax=Willisornis vidua TaxID=1566151 RepID=A0ABQ9CWW1_9PASS|nr:hypothetical protein WISP_106084 [Willisornis vidua]